MPPISTHTPLAGRDPDSFDSCISSISLFLLTRPSRGATGCKCYTFFTTSFLLTRPSRGATPWPGIWLSTIRNFYSHAPRGARLRIDAGETRRYSISTHTPLAGRDGFIHLTVSTGYNFYSHAPRGARRKAGHYMTISGDFYSHAPRGARRRYNACLALVYNFYSHAPRGARHISLKHALAVDNFYSHAPRGARPAPRPTENSSYVFLLTRPSRGATEEVRNE